MDILIYDKDFKIEQKDSYPYVQEWRLPITTLVQSANFTGDFFRFDIGVSDNDGTGNERTALIFWNSNNDDQWNSVQSQGYVKMTGTNLNKTTLSKDKSYFDAFPKTIDTIFVNSIDSFSISSSRDWIHYRYNDGLNKFITIWVDDNVSGEKRIGSIELEGWIDDFYIDVTQNSYTGIDNLSEQISIYPNPVTDYLNILTDGSELAQSAELYNLDGKCIYHSKITSQLTLVNMDLFSPGVYIAKIGFSDGSIVNKRIIKK
jgi:hypothetical protein